MTVLCFSTDSISCRIIRRCLNCEAAYFCVEDSVMHVTSDNTTDIVAEQTQPEVAVDKPIEETETQVEKSKDRGSKPKLSKLTAESLKEALAKIPSESDSSVEQDESVEVLRQDVFPSREDEYGILVGRAIDDDCFDWVS